MGFTGFLKLHNRFYILESLNFRHSKKVANNERMNYSDKTQPVKCESYYSDPPFCCLSNFGSLCNLQLRCFAAAAHILPCKQFPIYYSMQLPQLYSRPKIGHGVFSCEHEARIQMPKRQERFYKNVGTLVNCSSKVTLITWLL